MNIQTKHEPGKTILELEGRLDASWSDFLGTAIDHEIHRGEHFVVLDMTKVPFMSSAGIGVLLKYQRKLNSVGGSLSVCNPSENVLSVLKLMRLTDKLMVPQSTPTSHTSTTSPASSSQNSTPLSGSSLSSSSTLTSSSTNGFRDASGVQFEANLIAAGSRLNCILIGDPASFANGAQPSIETTESNLEGTRFASDSERFAATFSPNSPMTSR
jgi:anti-anti-sigma factor